MKKLAFALSLLVLSCNALAGQDCVGADGSLGNRVQCAQLVAAGESALPQAAQAQVDELKAKMRYFTAIGFHKQAGEKRDEIAAIYQKHGVPLPDEFEQ